MKESRSIRVTRSTLLLVLSTALFLACPAPGGNPRQKEAARQVSATTPAAPAPMGEADPTSARIVKELTDAMGGQQAWDRLPYFRFDFVVVAQGKEKARFRHWWDKRLGRCRVEGPDDQGRRVTAIFTLADKKGKSFTDDVVDTDSATTASRIQNGYERWVNDTYWVMMPFKLRDPGTHLKFSRSARGERGETYDVLELTFSSGVGLTPQDHYWLYVNQKTHLIDRWDMLLTDQKPPPQSATWESWTQVGPVQLSLLRRLVGKPVMLRFENVATPERMDETVFTHSRVIE
jgi:hypothetical protein